MPELVRFSAQSSPPPASFQPNRRDPFLHSDVGIEASAVPFWKTTLGPLFASSPMESSFLTAVSPILGAFSSPNFYLILFRRLESGIVGPKAAREQATAIETSDLESSKTPIPSLLCHLSRFCPPDDGTPATGWDIPKSHRGPCVPSSEFLSIGSHDRRQCPLIVNSLVSISMKLHYPPDCSRWRRRTLQINDGTTTSSRPYSR